MHQHSFADPVQGGPDKWLMPPAQLPKATTVVALFADIVGYTEHCEDLAPEEAFLLLSEFYCHADYATAAHDAGFVDHFGDEVLAVWKNDVPLGLQALKALHCGFALLAEIDQWNVWRLENGLASVKVGVGIHAGPAVLGRPFGGFGGSTSVFGDTVNIASRLERQTRRLGASIVISDKLFRLAARNAGDDAILDHFPSTITVNLSGRTAPFEIRPAALRQ